VCLYCSYCLLVSFSFFPRWRSVCPGAMLLWPRLICGSTVVPWSSPGLCLPKPSGRGRLVARGPFWFLYLMWSGDSLCWLEVWRGQSYASSQWLCLQSVSSVSPRFHYRRLALCFLPLAATLESLWSELFISSD
jgi:hypothetical protein